MSAFAMRSGGMEWKKPRDGKEFVGFLAGSRRDTREEFSREIWRRYGIRIVRHIGHEHRKEINSLFIPSNTEVVVIITDDIYDPQLKKVLSCIKAIPGCESVGIEYSKRKNPAAWDPSFVGNGYSSPPKWRDGALIEAPDLKKIDEQRKKELEELEKPRLAYVDPKLAAPKLADKAAAVAVLNQYVPKPPPKEEPKKGGPKTVRPGESVPSPPGWATEVRQAREKLGLSQGEFGKRIGIKQSGPSAWERGKGVPSYEIWLKLHELCPDLSEPEGIKGQKAYAERHKHDAKPPAKPAVALVPPPAPYTPPGTKTAAQAFGNGAAKAPVVETPPPPPPTPKEVFLDLAQQGPPTGALAAAQMPPPVTPPAVPAAPAPTGSDEQVTIKLRSGGSLTLHATVNLFRLRGEDRAFVFDIIDRLEAYEKAGEKKE